MRRKKIVLVGLGLLVIPVALFSAPRLIRTYIERTYPYVKVGRVELGWPVSLYDVKIRKDGIQADLREVRATPRKSDTVHVLGGSVHIIRKKEEGQRTFRQESAGRSIIAKGLRVSIESDGTLVTLEEASIDDKYRFERGSILHHKHLITLGPGSSSKDLQEVSLVSADVEVALPIELPKVPSKSVLRVEGIKASLPKQTAEIDSISYGPVKIKHTEVHRQGSDIVGKLQEIEVHHPWVSVEPVRFHEMGFNIPWPISVADFTIGKVHIHTEPKKYRILGNASCGDWLGALPEPLPEALRGSPENWKGRLGFEVQAKGKAKIDLDFNCKYTCSAEPIKSLRAGQFKYMAYNQKGELFERTVGRNIAGWTNLIDIPSSVTKAFITLEDPGFLSHKGIIVQALQNSLTDNLKLGKFFRGGSTITQQLAKNLWLRRHKTLSRKVYETLLAIALESCLSKEDILELYLNVVEFGPDLYGIGPASKHYFSKEVGDLLPEEAFYLAALLPRPSKAVPPNQGGLDAARRLMKQLINSGFLPDAYLSEDTSSDGWQTND